MISEPTRKEFLQAVGALALLPAVAAARSTFPKVLIVVAHPDDEYACAATIYRISRELGGIVDQVVITNGEAGYRYSALAESIYRVSLTNEPEGRSKLPSIRRAETLRAGEILGVRKHYFLNQRDVGFKDKAADAASANWDRAHVLSVIENLLEREHYDFVFTMLPTAETHGHHRAATLLALEAVSRLPEHDRPAVLGAEPGEKQDSERRAEGLPAFTFDRTTTFGYHNALNYQIVVNWVIAEHKSQGLFQQDYGRHEVERFWLLANSSPEASVRTRELASSLTPVQSVAK